MATTTEHRAGRARTAQDESQGLGPDLASINDPDELLDEPEEPYPDPPTYGRTRMIGERTALDLPTDPPPPQLVAEFLTPEGPTILYGKGGTGQGELAPTAEPEGWMGLVHRPRLDFEALDLVMAPVKINLGLRPEQFDELDRLFEAGPAFFQGGLVQLKLVGLVAKSRAEDEAAVGHDVEHRRVFGDSDRVVEGQDNDVRAEQDPLGDGG